jgi:glycosyltransferase involved in cell wall biosynthesis
VNAHPVRVLFDTEIFGNEVHGGISRYFAQLARHLPAHGVFPRILAPVTFNHYLDPRISPGVIGFRVPDCLRNRYTGYVARRILMMTDRVARSLFTFDILHQTYYRRDSNLTQARVVTVHDMIPELFPAFFTKGNPHAGKREACEAAALVIAISECTKRDLLKLYPELDLDIEVIPHAVDVEYFRSRARGYDDGTILFVGRRSAYKDFQVFAKATASILADQPNLRVLCVGGGPFKSDEVVPFVEQGVASRVCQRAVHDEELPTLYRRARAFVFSSRYEGFGLPILEAFASDCPVVLANASSFPEVAAEAAEYFVPGNVDSLLESLRKVVADAPYREQLRARGRRRLSAFSWDRSAALTAAAYRRVLGEKS